MFMRTVFAAIFAAALFSLAPAQQQPKLQFRTDQPKTEQPRPQQTSPEAARLIESVEGPALYKAYCAVCHGNDARSGGPMAMALRVSPSDLTRIAARNGGVYPLVRVERIISGEEPVPGGHGTRTMPVWGPIFSQIAWDQDLGRMRIHNLAVHLGRLQAH
jgi:mono/diheme cytochrome c family protein